MRYSSVEFKRKQKKNATNEFAVIRWNVEIKKIEAENVFVYDGKATETTGREKVCLLFPNLTFFLFRIGYVSLTTVVWAIVDC